MWFIGNIHSKLERYFNLIKVLPESIQIGDFGIGFERTPYIWDRIPSIWNKKHKFIRGNHDNPSACRKHPNYLGDWGLTDDGIFYVSGAFSIDYEWRQQYELARGVKVWWKDEQIPSSEYAKIYDLYDRAKPKIIVSHDCPVDVQKYMRAGNIIAKQEYPNRTSGQLLTNLLSLHEPEHWIFGHYHGTFDCLINKTRFRCLSELEACEVKL